MIENLLLLHARPISSFQIGKTQPKNLFDFRLMCDERHTYVRTVFQSLLGHMFSYTRYKVRRILRTCAFANTFLCSI